MEQIDGIKIIQVDGLNTGAGAGGNGAEATAAQVNLADQLVSSALRYRGQAPLVDSLLADIGLSGKDLGGVTQVLRTDAAGSKLSEQTQAPGGQPPAPTDPESP
jgi:uncharacterized membrane protein YqiK